MNFLIEIRKCLQVLLKKIILLIFIQMNYLDVNIKECLHRVLRISRFINQVKLSFCYLTSRETSKVFSHFHIGIVEMEIMSLTSSCCYHQYNNIVDRLTGSLGLVLILLFQGLV